MVRATTVWRFLPLLALAPLLAAAAPARGGGDLRVLSYNVNYGLAGDRETMDAIAAADADVVFLQEADGAWAAALRDRFASRYPHQARVESSPAGSLVVLSRWRLDEGDVVDSPAGWFPLWRVVVHTPAGDLQALQVHLHPPYDERGGWVLGPFLTGDERAAELAAGLASLDPSLPTVVLGDFNERRGDALRLAVDAGLRDAVVAFDPDAVTWRWDLPVGRLTGQLDHLFHDARVEVLQLEVRDAGRSDHLPIVADLRLVRGG